jgi:hypothetical protein
VVARADSAFYSAAFTGAVRGATLRRDLIHVAARTARHGHVTLHLPAGWHRGRDWISLSKATCGPPAKAA